MRYSLEFYDSSDVPKLTSVEISQERAIKFLSRVCEDADYVILTTFHACSFNLGSINLKLIPENFLEF